MDKEQAAKWQELLGDEQKEKLRWLQNHRCSIEGSWAAADPLHDLPEGLVLEVIVDRHGMVKARSNDARDVPEMFDHLYESARNLFSWVQRYDPDWSGGTGG